MTLDFGHDPRLERSPTRRWISIIAVVIPVVAVVMLSVSFIRTYILPPTIAIPSAEMVTASAPVTLMRVQPQAPRLAQEPADAPMQPATLPEQTASEIAAVQTPAADPAPATEKIETSPSLPMLATLAAVPPAFSSLPAATVESAEDSPATTAAIPATEPEATDAAMPIAEPVPLPRRKPRISVASMSGHVPLPRPKPQEAVAEPETPIFERHGVE